MALVEVIQVIVDDDRNVIDLRVRDINGAWEQGKIFKTLVDLVRSFGSTVISQGRNFPTDTYAFRLAIDESTELTEEEKERYKRVILERGAFDIVKITRGSEIPGYKPPIRKGGDAPPPPRQLVTIFVDP